MKVDTKRACFAIELSAGGEPPKEFCLFKAGPNRAHDGRGTFVFDELSAAACVKHCEERGLDYVIDYEHASLQFLMADPAEAGKAAGWFKPAIRDGSLWATDVQWTDAAAAKLKAREYRYFSPAADYEVTPDETKRITKLINCALTNNPALAGIPPLMASATAEPPPKETRMKTLFAALSLAETATEAEALAAVTALRDSTAAVLSLTGKTTAPEALAVLTAWKTDAEKVATLSSKVQELETAKLTAERDALIEQGKKDGKLPPALEPWAKTQSSDSLKAFLSAAPKVGTTTVVEPANAETGDIDAAMSEIAKLMGQDPKKVAEFKAKKNAAA